MRKHSWMVTVCLVACLSAAGPARAQTPSPDAMAAAHELIVTMRAVDFFKTIMPTLMQGLKPAIVQNRPEVERDYDAIVPLMLESMNARVNEVIEQIAAVYARNFTADELRGRRVLPRADENIDQRAAFGAQQAFALAAQRAPRPHDRRVAQARPQYLSFARRSQTIALIALSAGARANPSRRRGRTRSSIPARSPAAPIGADISPAPSP
jgi:hypothetical protein